MITISGVTPRDAPPAPYAGWYRLAAALTNHQALSTDRSQVGGEGPRLVEVAGPW